jgi:hypothetical protein
VWNYDFVMDQTEDCCDDPQPSPKSSMALSEEAMAASAAKMPNLIHVQVVAIDVQISRSLAVFMTFGRLITPLLVVN